MVVHRRYRAEVDDEGTAVPPRQHKLRPLDSADALSETGDAGSDSPSSKASLSKDPLPPKQALKSALRSRPCSSAEGHPAPRGLPLAPQAASPCLKPALQAGGHRPETPLVLSPVQTGASCMKGSVRDSSASQRPPRPLSGGVPPGKPLRPAMKHSSTLPVQRAAPAIDEPRGRSPLKPAMKVSSRCNTLLLESQEAAPVKSAMKARSTTRVSTVSPLPPPDPPARTGGRGLGGRRETMFAPRVSTKDDDEMEVWDSFEGQTVGWHSKEAGPCGIGRGTLGDVCLIDSAVLDEYSKPLSLDDDRPDRWSARGLCKRAYWRASQQTMWREQEERIASEAMRRMSMMDVGVGLSRRMSSHQAVLTADGMLLMGGSGPSSPKTTGPSAIPRSTSVLICADDDAPRIRNILCKVENIEECDETALSDHDTPQDAAPATPEGGAGTGAMDSPPGSCDAPADAADTGGTPPQLKGNPLKDLMTAKKVDVQQLRQLLQELPDVSRWVNSPLGSGPPPLPEPLFFAIGATLPHVVGLLLEFSADVNKTYGGARMYNGWIKPAATPIEAVSNRRGRFVGTMLGDRLDQILEILQLANSTQKAGKQSKPGEGAAAEKVVIEKIEEKLAKIQKKEDAAKGGSGQRKSVKLAAARGVIEHTQGHPAAKYDVVAPLGEGGMSTVKMAIFRRTGERRAIKSEMKVEEGYIWDEIAIMRKLNHPNVIQLYETFEDESHIFAVLDVCAGGGLFDRLTSCGGLPERDAVRIMEQLAGALGYIHQQGICHRDIQPENFLLKDDRPLKEANVVLIDFTTAKEFGPANPMKTKICTLHYVAPEILTRKLVPYTEKVDVWSLGVVFYMMLSGCPPFTGDTELAVLKKIKKGQFAFEPSVVWEGISRELKDLVARMLVVDVANRYSADDVQNYPWLQRPHYQRSTKHQNHLSSAQLNNLRNFHARTRVQKAVHRLRAQQLSDAAVGELRSMFRGLDKDGTGEIHISSIRDKLRRIPSLSANMEEIMRVIWGLEGGTGKVNFDSFLTAMVSKQKLMQKEACHAIFDVFDYDGNGTISQEELDLALRFGTDADTFKSGIETVFGVSAGDMQSRFSHTRTEYTFDEFLNLMQLHVT